MKDRLMGSRRWQIKMGGVVAFLIILLIGFFLLPTSVLYWSSSNEVAYKAYFDNVGDLKVQAPVKIAGVVLGKVESISLECESMRAEVSFSIGRGYAKFISPLSTVVVEPSLLFGETILSIQPVPGYSGDGAPGGAVFVKTKSPISVGDIMVLGEQIAPLLTMITSPAEGRGENVQ